MCIIVTGNHLSYGSNISLSDFRDCCHVRKKKMALVDEIKILRIEHAYVLLLRNLLMDRDNEIIVTPQTVNTMTAMNVK